MKSDGAENNRPDESMTLKDLTPQVAALLCYVGGWISGIVFLVLEQKNRFVRFHSLQSIIVFGIITLVASVFGNLPVVGRFFGTIIGITAFILWIILMVKALNGEYFKMPLAGNLAERLTNESMGPKPQPGSQPGPADNIPPSEASALAAAPAASSSAGLSKAAVFRDRYYSDRERDGRITASAFAIAWSIALLIFFNFYNRYIAWYEPVTSGGETTWQVHTLITSDFNSWLPVLTAALVLSIISHAVLIAIDKYVLRQALQIFLDIFSVVVVISLLSIFPFDFSSLPGSDTAHWVTIGVTFTLIIMAIGFGIGALVRLIQLIVNVAEGKY